jgi:hypothetical protein
MKLWRRREEEGEEGGKEGRRTYEYSVQNVPLSGPALETWWM